MKDILKNRVKLFKMKTLESEMENTTEGIKTDQKLWEERLVNLKAETIQNEIWRKRLNKKSRVSMSLGKLQMT